MFKRFASGLAVVAVLAGVLVVGVPASSQAAQLEARSVRPAATPNDSFPEFWEVGMDAGTVKSARYKKPSPLQKWRQYMLTVPGKLVAPWRVSSGSSAMNSAEFHKSELAAERYALRNVVGASADELNALLGYRPLVAERKLNPTTGKWEHVVSHQLGAAAMAANGVESATLEGISAATRRSEQNTRFKELAKKLGYQKPAPLLTKKAKFMRAAGSTVGALSAITFVPLVAQGTGAVMSFLGVSDDYGAFCSLGDNGNWVEAGFFGLLEVANGLDCSQVGQVSDEWIQAVGEIVGAEACIPDTDTCITVKGMVTQAENSGNNWYVGMVCVLVDGLSEARQLPAGWVIDFRDPELNNPPLLWGTTYARGLETTNRCGGLGNTKDNPLPVGKGVALFSPSSVEWLRFVYLVNGTAVPIEMPSGGEEQLTCEVTLEDGRVLTAVGEPFDDSPGNQIAMPQCPEIPEDGVPTRVKVKDKNGNELFDEPTDDEALDWMKNNGECVNGLCLLDLHVVADNNQDYSMSCFDLDEGCPDWFEDPQRNEKFQCYYNMKPVEIQQCYVYAGLWKPGRTDNDSPWSDNETGSWSGNKNTTSNGKSAFAKKVQDPTKARTCTFDGIEGFDPIGFVMRPVQCAMEWAFVPRPTWVKVKLAGGEDAWKGKPPGVIADAVSGFAVTPAVSGCSRDVTIFAGRYASQITPLNVCPGSWGATVAAVTKVAATVAMVVLVVVVVRRQIAGMIGYGRGQ